ncbi:Low specificity L-threonine aldolase [Candidatus Methylobacter favarea]|uniref:L-threonine aldolase n=1 Tax=Candidatus Methylobacter favarea TaxID=2707345 RepID=A0A8S0X2I1_9GAMM|nr:low specificity L-threonine aldolase [Candidatus Methylobacter favarea]CAA9891934.1 Low specificity L-threonine aldolase [Candidatus Methylobacter favarea]
MIFASDNWAGAHPAITRRLSDEAAGFSVPYGASELDHVVEKKFNELFEREVAVFFVATGTAANSLALAAVNRPGGVSFCHREAHMIEDECGAPEFFTHGARLAPVDGENGKIDPQSLKSEIYRFPPGFIHAGQPMAISITQATEIGTLYHPDEILAISEIAKNNGLPLHMDGARFANALVALNLSPAEMTWKRGVDIVSFGATKNGCWCAEALVFMHPEMAADLPFIRKRAAQLFSKTRFIASQFDAYLNDNLWLDMARHANNMGQRLQNGIITSKNARLAWRAEANEVFCIVDKELEDQLRQKGAVFYAWNPPRSKPGLLGENEILLRLVTSFATEEDEVDRFIDLLG